MVWLVLPTQANSCSPIASHKFRAQLLFHTRGRRPLIVELQALTSVAPPGVPARRTAQGVDQSRLAMLLAVLARHCDVPLQPPTYTPQLLVVYALPSPALISH